MLWLVVVAVELLIFMCVNKLLAGKGDPTGMIYPAGYGSRENSPPITGIDILMVPNFYGGDESRMTIPDEDLPIATLIHASSLSFPGRALVELKVAHSRTTFMNIHEQSSHPSFTSRSKLFLFPYFQGRDIENDIARTNTH